MPVDAEASREARAKVIVVADGEMKSSKVLKDASYVISASQSALEIRFLQTLTHNNSTIFCSLADIHF